VEGTQQAPARIGAPSPQTPRELLGELQRSRNDIVSALANGRFKVELLKDEITALENDAVAALPNILSRLGAQLYYEAATTTINQIANMVPQMIAGYLNESSQNNQAVDAFSAAFPQINMRDASVQNVVAQVAATFRSMNPQVPRDQAIQFVGRYVCQQLGLPLNAAGAARGNGQRAPRAPAFSPAGGVGHGAPRTPAGQGQDNPWSGMGQSFDE